MGSDSGIRKEYGRQARGEVGRQWAFRAWIALAHGFWHPGTFRGVADRFFDYSPARTWKHGSAPDPARGAWCKSFVCSSCGHCGVHPGGYLTWGAGAKGGEAALHRYLPKRFARRLSGWVENNGTLAVTTSALLPPPFPLMPFLLAAGALGVSRKKFLVSFSLARTLRYCLVTWLAATYGRAVVRAFRHYLAGWSTTLMWIYLGLVAAGILYGVWKFRHQRRRAGAPHGAALSTK